MAIIGAVPTDILDLLWELSSRRRWSDGTAMIISMPTLARSQQRYDHMLRNLVQRTDQ